MKIAQSIFILIIFVSAGTKYNTTFKHEEKLKTIPIIKDIPAMALGSFFLNDSIMITQDVRAKKDFIKVYDYKNNNLFIQFGNAGRGPDELPTPFLSGLCNEGEEFCLFDPNLKKIHKCEINSFSCKPNQVIDLKDVGLQFIFDAKQVAENLFIAKGLFKDGLFALINLTEGESVVTFNGKFPFAPKGIDSYQLSELNAGNITVDFSYKYLIYTAINVGYICCYKIENSHLEKIWEHWITEPKYSVSSGKIYLKNENILGFMDVAATDDFVYAVYHGKNMQAFRSQTAKDSPETIMKFSLKDGIPLARFTTDVPVTRIAVNPDGEVYCIAKPLGYNLVKVEL